MELHYWRRKIDCPCVHPGQVTLNKVGDEVSLHRRVVGKMTSLRRLTRQVVAKFPKGCKKA
jgi:hypothetical protein